MSYQVGLFCYATPVDAGQAACASYQPVSGVASAGNALVSSSCEGVDETTGALKLRIATSDISTGVTTYQTVEQLPAFAPCQYTEILSFWWAIIPAVLIALLPIWVYRCIRSLMPYREYE